MEYKDYEICAEAYTESAMYSLDERGFLSEHKYEIHIEPIIHSYCVLDQDGDEHGWFSSIAECKEYIDNKANPRELK